MEKYCTKCGHKFAAVAGRLSALLASRQQKRKPSAPPSSAPRGPRGTGSPSLSASAVVQARLSVLMQRYIACHFRRRLMRCCSQRHFLQNLEAHGMTSRRINRGGRKSRHRTYRTRHRTRRRKSRRHRRQRQQARQHRRQKKPPRQARWQKNKYQEGEKKSSPPLWCCRLSRRQERKDLS